jgi:nucleotide-binding universal stress UspA family protein
MSATTVSRNVARHLIEPGGFGVFEQIVVGVEEDKGSRDAIRIAQNLLARDGELTLAHVCTGDPHIYRGASAAYEASERERALEPLERTRKETGVHAQLRWRRSHSVGRGLHELCEAIGADLLVVGSSRCGLLGRVLIGDDTRAALGGAPCAIVIAPAGYLTEPETMREIGVGYDGSPESEHALELARQLATEAGAKLSAFEAIAIPSTALRTGPLPFDETVSRLVAEAHERIAALGDVEPHAAYGDPVDELAVYSASLDLLVVGSRGYGPLGRLIQGSISRKLARTARCPLLVLPRGASPIEKTPQAAEAGQQTRADVRT